MNDKFREIIEAFGAVDQRGQAVGAAGLVYPLGEAGLKRFIKREAIGNVAEAGLAVLDIGGDIVRSLSKRNSALCIRLKGENTPENG